MIRWFARNGIAANFLIPMAVSMGFGILSTTGITLFLMPCVLLLADDAAMAWHRWVAGHAAATALDSHQRTSP